MNRQRNILKYVIIKIKLLNMYVYHTCIFPNRFEKKVFKVSKLIASIFVLLTSNLFGLKYVN